MTADSSGDYLRTLDDAAISALAPDQRYSQPLIDATSGGVHAAVNYIRTPPGGGSPRGLHTHEWEQLFYIVEGTMNIEVDGREFEAQPGNLVVFPAGVPHKNWNATGEPTVHIAFNTPLPPAKTTQ